MTVGSANLKGIFAVTCSQETKINVTSYRRNETHPVDEDVFGKARVGVLNSAKSVHHLSTVQLLNQLLQTTI